MKKIKMLLAIVFVAFITFGMMSSADALLITPATTPQWSGTSPVNPQAADIPGLVGYSGTLTELYKQDVDGGESGPFASSYSTEFFNTPTDPEDATITYMSGPSITGDPLYLLVKDGNHDPIWYIFDLSSWNGTETIYLEDFWAPTTTSAGNGSISHVALYGPTSIPEPFTLILLGIGLVGIAGIRRRMER
ncbi:MAG TPA: PEP-CTERM sorting domain-containing protein [Syntrophales bacterium]|nr:PEP-CTERM sorting domain-containing protein [Syntrophales bacterium]